MITSTMLQKNSSTSVTMDRISLGFIVIMMPSSLIDFGELNAATVLVRKICFYLYCRKMRQTLKMLVLAHFHARGFVSKSVELLSAAQVTLIYLWKRCCRCHWILQRLVTERFHQRLRPPMPAVVPQLRPSHFTRSDSTELGPAILLIRVRRCYIEGCCRSVVGRFWTFLPISSFVQLSWIELSRVVWNIQSSVVTIVCLFLWLLYGIFVVRYDTNQSDCKYFCLFSNILVYKDARGYVYLTFWKIAPDTLFAEALFSVASHVMQG